MPTYYNIQTYLSDKAGVPLVIDISNESGNYLYLNQPTGAASQWWTIILDPTSGYSFIQSQWKNSEGKPVVIDIHGAGDMPIEGGTHLLDAYPQKMKDYDNQLWMAVGDPATGSVFYQSKLTDLAGKPLVIDVQGAIIQVGQAIDAFSQKPKDYANQLWTLAG